MAAAGLSRIPDERAPFSSAFNTAAHAEADPSVPHGWVLRGVKSGWLYKVAPMRKSAVVVNNMPENSNGTPSWA